MASTKALFCGLGSIGQRHLRNLRTLMGDDVEVLAYRARGTSPVLNRDMSVRQGAELEETYNVRSFTSMDDALSERPDVVFVTNPNTLHLPVALAAAKAGCHLFIEKPLSHSLDGVAELKEVVESRGTVAFVAYQFRFHPGLKLLKTLIDDGRLGSLAAAHIVNGEYLPDWHPYEDYRDTHPAHRHMGGGCLSIQTHELDYALWLFGMPTRVFAVGGQLSRLEIDVEDSVSLLLECRSHDAPLPVQIHLDYLQRPPQRYCEIVGDAGRVTFDYYGGRTDMFEVETGEHTVNTFDGLDRNEMFMSELEHFFRCVRGEDTPLIDLQEGERSLRIALAAARSLQTGTAATL